ncbi:unnamed protein product [Kluyveromyces dobzhanskii CBS 2104]|uniref:WGS project CCBQ000000000 data, contig 00016 n=1 Tax=Kluyveromyces dobzhanskii CBS 2104 TaxID=1427455 RepID=A0A0A8L1W9_9SACH|nr:unnamed protein product [Kluyveromyces dobzhanskii CBS 2104]
MMSGELVKFLTHLKALYLKTLKSCGAENKCHLNIVCGNESADLDSIVSSITYAYLRSLKDSSSPFLPLINIPRDDLKLRRDVCYLFNSHSIPSDLLYFREDLHNWKKESSCTINCVLVDHNDIPAISENLFTNIVGIVDHHKDAGLHSKTIDKFSGPRIVETAGSCSSLVFNYWFKTLNDSVKNREAIKEVVPLLLGALLIDTDNMKNKVEPIDKEVFGEYKNLLATSVDIDSFYQKLREAKDDIDGLDLHDILRKDYKEFIFGTNTRCGIASIVKSIQWIESEFGKSDIEEHCSKFIEENNLDLLVLMTSFTNDGVFAKQIAFQTNSDQKPDLLKALIDCLSPKLNLEKIDPLSTECFKCYDQKNIKASRKQVAPYVDAFINS